ncbi:Tim44 domain-containing protein [Desulfopila sp. IMCC35006]|uniref:Tim44 domain-containing protein n=1 Tax=Desulfopila sp. IMCC35006 TaxID=2569542 RepID=UPI0010AB87C6|nr:TIM44-like domain-containing protein [Desulfopila sp. IMCC35006]TKB28588.1 Tim44 domain-containing protein [Desulfopila sp. IMCC35006]
MMIFWKKLAPILMLFVAFTLLEAGLTADYADARSFGGGRSFKMTPRTPSRSMGPVAPTQRGGSFGRGLAGGLLGGALGGMLFGSMFGAGGSGMGILPLLVLGGIAYFLFKRFSTKPPQNGYQSYQQNPGPQSPSNMFSGAFGNSAQPPPVTPDIGGNLTADGIDQIKEHDRNFDPKHFTEVASDVFFKVQAGWMRRDLDSYRHLLGEQLAGEYADHFAEMRRKGHINKLESIAVRNLEIVQAGSDGREDFVTVLFAANLLDYTVDDKSGELVEGSMTTPVKFNEEWTWARPVGTEDWKLEGIKEV